MNIFTSEVEMLRADNEDLQKTLAKLFWDYTILERAFNDVTGAKWLRESDHPQCTWVGLTVEEIEAIGKPCEEKDRSIQAWGLFACAIEAKLKEKNT